MRWLAPMCVKKKGSGPERQSGGPAYAHPNMQCLVVLANVWMPHSGYKISEIQAAHTAFGELVSCWKKTLHCPSSCPPLVQQVKWSRRPLQTACTKAADEAFGSMLAATGLQPPNSSVEPTWESNDGMMQSSNDHAVCTDCGIIQ